MSQPNGNMEQQSNAIDGLENELERFRKKWLEELAADEEKISKEQTYDTTAGMEKSTAIADGTENV